MRNSIAAFLWLILSLATSFAHADDARYQQERPANAEGIGKFYMGREIAYVMGFGAAPWLERPEREREEQLTKMVKALQLKALGLDELDALWQEVKREEAAHEERAASGEGVA